MVGRAGKERPLSTSPSHSLPVLADPNPAASRTNRHAHQGRRPPAARWLAAALILIAGALLPAWIAGRAAPNPRTRDLHIEAYRYGFSPSRIHVNRGNRLRLSFSTRDTGQSFFLQDYDLHVAITPGARGWSRIASGNYRKSVNAGPVAVSASGTELMQLAGGDGAAGERAVDCHGFES